MKVLTSDSAPSARISWPFQRKVTPAALPTLATISRRARTEVWAGAMRVSWLTGCPSAVMEIQEFSVARMRSVRVGAVVSGDLGFDFAGVGRGASSLVSPEDFGIADIECGVVTVVVTGGCADGCGEVGDPGEVWGAGAEADAWAVCASWAAEELAEAVRRL